MLAPPRVLLPIALVLALGACGDKGTTAPDAVTSGPAALRTELQIHWDRDAGTLTAYGVPKGTVSERLQELAAGLEMKDLTIARPGRPATTDAALVGLLEQLVRLERARVVMRGEAIEVRGVARRARRKAAVEEAVRGLGPAVEATLDVVIDEASLRPDEGVLELVGFEGSIEDLAPRPIMKGADALGEAKDAAGDPLVDERGRIAEGLYELADGTSVGIVRGRKTVVKRGAPAILVGQRRFVLDDDIPLVALDAADALSFAARATGPDGMPTHGPRYERAGVPVKRDDLPHARRVVTAMTLHADEADESKGAFEALVARSLSTHFFIDFDGRVFQALDPIDCAYHAGDMNSWTLGVDLNNRMRNLLRAPDEPPYDPRHARIAEMEKHPRGARQRATIQGVEVEAWGYTEAQYRSLAALTRRLADIFPAIALGAPKGADGKVPLDALPPEAWRGVIGHLHGEPQRWDPGIFDWGRIDQALATRALEPGEPPTPRLPPIDPGAAPGGPTTSAKVHASWSRVDGVLQISRAEHAGLAVQAARKRAEALGATRFALTEPALPDLPDASLSALLDALLALKEGTLAIEGKRATLVGRAHLPADLEVVKAAVARAEGVTVDSELEVDVQTLLAGEGRIEAVGGELPKVKRLSDGSAVAPDALGRVPAGTYTLSDGTHAVVVAGRVTRVALRGAPIVVAGRRYRLDRTEVKVVGADALPAVEAPRAEVDVVVLTSDGAYDAESGKALLARRGVEPHFTIDFDGTLIAARDPAAKGRVGDPIDQRAIVIALTHPLVNLEKIPDAPAFPADHPRAAELAAHERPNAKRDTINGGIVKTLGYTEAQYVTLGSLLRRLGELFPAVTLGPPRDARGRLVTRTLDARDVARPVGVLAQWHLQFDEWAPGPGLDWARVTRELGGGPLEEAAGRAGARRIAARFLGPEVDRIGLLERLHPSREDCDVLFRSEANENCRLEALRASWGVTARWVMGSLHGPLVIDEVTSAAIAAGEIGGFSDTIHRLAGALPEDVTFYRVAFGRGDDAPALEGLVYVNGRWVFFPEPGKLVPKGP